MASMLPATPLAFRSRNPTHMVSSLDILRPSPSSTIEDLDSNPVGSLAKDLEDKSSTLIGLMSRGDWTHPDIERYIDSNWVANQPWINPTPGRQVCCERFSSFDQIFIGGKTGELEVISVSADVNEAEGRACVWMMLALKDANDVKRERITAMQWKITGALWKCYEHNALCELSGFCV